MLKYRGSASEFGTAPARNAATSSRIASGTVYRGSQPSSRRIFSLDTWYDRRSSVGDVTIRTSSPTSAFTSSAISRIVRFCQPAL